MGFLWILFHLIKTAIIATKRTMTTASNTDMIEARIAIEVFVSCSMVGEEVGTE